MRHRRTTKRLGRSAAARRGLVKNLLRSFFLAGKIRTTEAKAKHIKPMVERMITLGKQNSLHARRTIIQKTGSAAVAKIILDDISPRYKERKGGYTRITKIANRKGDGAREVFLTYV